MPTLFARSTPVPPFDGAGMVRVLHTILCWVFAYLRLCISMLTARRTRVVTDWIVCVRPWCPVAGSRRHVARGNQGRMTTTFMAVHHSCHHPRAGEATPAILGCNKQAMNAVRPSPSTGVEPREINARRDAAINPFVIPPCHHDGWRGLSWDDCHRPCNEHHVGTKSRRASTRQ